MAFVTQDTVSVTLLSHYNNASGCDWYLRINDTVGGDSNSYMTMTQCRTLQVNSSIINSFSRTLLYIPRSFQAVCVCRDCRQPQAAHAACLVKYNVPGVCVSSQYSSTEVEVVMSTAAQFGVLTVPAPNCTNGTLPALCNGDGFCNTTAGEHRRNYCGVWHMANRHAWP